MRLLLLGLSLLMSKKLMSQVFCEGVADYLGKIGSKPIGMSLVKDASLDQVVGTYFYKSDLKDIPLKGSVRERQLVLNEYASDGTLRGTFHLQMPTRDPKGRLSGALNGEILTGEWTDDQGVKTLSVTLELEDILIGDMQLINRYASTDTTSEPELEKTHNLFTLRSYEMKRIAPPSLFTTH